MHEEDVMPVILELEDYEADLVVDALMEGRIRLMKDWEDRWRSPGRGPFEDDLAHIDADIVAVADIREHLKEGIMVQHLCQNRAIDREKKVSVAWHHERGWLPSADFVEKPIEGATTQDQLSPGTWTTLPEGYEVDADPYEITDPKKKIVIASADTQTDGTMLGFYRYSLTPPEKRLDVVITINGKTEMLSGNATEIEGVIKELTSAAVS